MLVSLSGITQEADFFPEQNIWQTLSLDPIAAQSFAQIAAVWEGSDQADYLMTGFSFGFQKSIILWKKSDSRKLDIGLEGSAVTQFEWTNREGSFQRNILSTDYIVGIPVVWQIDDLMLRFRIYHLSSHMGDDYMIRNKITGYYHNNNNYEQLDVTASYFHKNFRFNFGIGTILRASNTRKPLVFNSGMDYILPLNKNKTASFYAGFYADMKQETNYSPSFNIGAGVKLGKPNRRGIKLLVTYFNGPLPYSVYYGSPIQWLGMAFYLNPF